MSLEMAHKVIVPPKKNYIPQFLKQRDINSYYTAAYVFLTPPIVYQICGKNLKPAEDLPLNSFIQEQELFPLAKTAATLQKNLAKEGRLPNFPTSVFAKVRGEPGILKGCGRSARC